MREDETRSPDISEVAVKKRGRMIDSMNAPFGLT